MAPVGSVLGERGRFERVRIDFKGVLWWQRRTDVLGGDRGLGLADHVARGLAVKAGLVVGDVDCCESVAIDSRSKGQGRREDLLLSVRQHT
jgi:hypothetical protein